jgi:hypothetical protein
MVLPDESSARYLCVNYLGCKHHLELWSPDSLSQEEDDNISVWAAWDLGKASAVLARRYFEMVVH